MIGLVQILAEVTSIARAPAWVKIVGSGGDFPIVTQYWHSDTYVKYDARLKLIDCISSFIECKVRSNAKKKIGI